MPNFGEENRFAFNNFDQPTNASNNNNSNEVRGSNGSAQGGIPGPQHEVGNEEGGIVPNLPEHKEDWAGNGFQQDTNGWM